MIERGEANLAGFKPGDALAVGRYGNLRDGAAVVQAGKDLIKLGGSGLRGRGLSASEERREEADEDKGAQ